MKKTLLLVVLSAAFLVVGIFIGYRMADKPRPSLITASNPAISSSVLSPVDAYIEESLTSRSLLDMAKSKTYESSNSQQKMDLVKEWCETDTLSELSRLSPDDQSFAIRRLKTQLDNLLAERAFDEES